MHTSGSHGIVTFVTSANYDAFYTFYEFISKENHFPIYIVTYDLRNHQITFLQSMFNVKVIRGYNKILDPDILTPLAIQAAAKHVDYMLFVNLGFLVLGSVEPLLRLIHDSVVLLKNQNQNRPFVVDANLIGLDSKRDLPLLEPWFTAATNSINPIQALSDLVSLNTLGNIIDDLRWHYPAKKRVMHPSEDNLQAIQDDHPTAIIVDYTGIKLPYMRLFNHDAVKNYFISQEASFETKRYLITGCNAYLKPAITNVRAAMRRKAAVYLDETPLASMVNANLASFSSDHLTWFNRTDCPVVITVGHHYHLILSQLKNTLADFHTICVVNDPFVEFENWIATGKIGWKHLKECDFETQRNYYKLLKGDQSVACQASEAMMVNADSLIDQYINTYSRMIDNLMAFESDNKSVIICSSADDLQSNLLKLFNVNIRLNQTDDNHSTINVWTKDWLRHHKASVDKMYLRLKIKHKRWLFDRHFI
jgi:hypothetical protein